MIVKEKSCFDVWNDKCSALQSGQVYYLANLIEAFTVKLKDYNIPSDEADKIDSAQVKIAYQKLPKENLFSIV